MCETRIHPVKKWVVSLIALKENGSKFKVARRLPEWSVAEIKFFARKEDAKKQFEQWLE